MQTGNEGGWEKQELERGERWRGFRELIGRGFWAQKVIIIIIPLPLDPDPG